MPQHIIVTEYSPLWADEFETEAKEILRILGENCIAIHHIGSTAVPNLCAKPIIDIMPIVSKITIVDNCKSEFEKIGYEYLGEFGITGRRYLRKGGDERTHQIHIFEQSNKFDIERHIAVRDYLRSHKDVAKRYGELKLTLARKFPYSIDDYCDGKESFVREMEQKALVWKKEQSMNINEITIRPYKQTDWVAIEKIHDSARKIELALANLSEAFLPLLVAAEREDLFSYDGLFVAETNGQVVGFTACTNEELAWLYVAPEFMRKGVGRKLALYVLSAFPTINYLEVLKGNKPAKSLYESLGFQVSCTEIGKMPGNEEYIVEVYCMRRK